VNLRKDHFNNNQNTKTFYTAFQLLLGALRYYTGFVRFGSWAGYGRSQNFGFGFVEVEFYTQRRLLPSFFFSHQLLDLDTNVTSAKCIKQNTPFNDGPLGSRNDEERGKMRKCSMNCRI